MATLGFSTHFPKEMGGKPTYFIPKIWNGLMSNDIVSSIDICDHIIGMNAKFGNRLPEDTFPYDQTQPKLHTIRQDKRNLWVPGRKVHAVINNRTKKRFQFAPVFEVKSVQRIDVLNNTDGGTINRLVEVDGNQIYCEGFGVHNLVSTSKEMEQLAKNDGFDSIDHFFQWFKEDFSGKIIHWTDFRY